VNGFGVRLVTATRDVICVTCIVQTQIAAISSWSAVWGFNCFNVCILSAVNLCGCSTVLMFVSYPLSIMSVFYSLFLGLSYCTV